MKFTPYHTMNDDSLELVAKDSFREAVSSSLVSLGVA